MKSLIIRFLKLCLCFLTIYWIPLSSLENISQYTVEQFLETISYRDGSFNHDESEILFSSDKNGVFNVYSLSIQTNELKQLTYSTNQACYLISAFSNDNRFLYQSDLLGNELTHIWLYNEDHTQRDLTPEPQAKSEFLQWSQDKKSFFYLSNLRDSRYFDLYEMDIETFNPVLVYVNETGFSINAISPNNRYLSLTKVVDRNTSELYLYDLLEKSLKLLIPYQEEIHFHGRCFDKNSKKLYFLTDEESDFIYLKTYDIESNQVNLVEKCN